MTVLPWSDTSVSRLLFLISDWETFGVKDLNGEEEWREIVALGRDSRSVCEELSQWSHAEIKQEICCHVLEPTKSTNMKNT